MFAYIIAIVLQDGLSRLGGTKLNIKILFMAVT